MDAALALPAHSYNGRERVYFFKGTQGWAGGCADSGAVLGFFHTSLGMSLCLSPTSPPHPTSPTPNPHRSSQLPQPWGFRLAHGHPSPGNHYWEYVFQQQPSREECEGSSQPAAFKHFALMQRDSWEDIFRLLFWGGSFGTEGGWEHETCFPVQGAGSPQVAGGLGQPERLQLCSNLSKAICSGCSGQTLLLLTLVGGGLPPPGPHTLDFA